MRPVKVLGIVPRSHGTNPTHRTRADQVQPGSGEQPHIREGAWAAWAGRAAPGAAIPTSEFACTLPDGREGVVAAIFEDGAWRLACRAA